MPGASGLLIAIKRLTVGRANLLSGSATWFIPHSEFLTLSRWAWSFVRKSASTV